MNIRAQGRKKSTFPGDTVIPSGATFDYVHNGVNIKIPIANLLTALNVTGSIVQAGDPLAVPVLEKQGSVHKIRNLEADENSGLKFSVSPENGIRAELDAQTTGGGVPVLNPKNHIRRIRSGSGIAVSLSGEDIIVSDVSTPGASSVVVINELADFPSPVGGVIPLTADTVYFIQDIIDIGNNTFTLAANTVMTGFSFAVTGITTTGSGFLFENAGAFTNEINGLRITAPNCTIFGLTSLSAGANLLLGQISIVSCVSIVDVKACAIFRSGGVTATCSADAFIFSGTCDVVIITDVIVRAWTGVLFELDGAMFGRFSITTVQAASASGANVVVEGQVSSANIAVGAVGEITRVIVTGAVIASTTIFPSDLRWQFLENSFAADSVVNALLSLQANAVNTVIALIDTPVLVAGAWTVEHDNKMTGTVGGRVTYDAQRDTDPSIVASLTVSPVSGGTQTISIYLALNGSVIANSRRTSAVASGSTTSITLTWGLTLETNDFVEVFVSNDSGTTDILVSAAVCKFG